MSGNSDEHQRPDAPDRDRPTSIPSHVLRNLHATALLNLEANEMNAISDLSSVRAKAQRLLGPAVEEFRGIVQSDILDCIRRAGDVRSQAQCKNLRVQIMGLIVKAKRVFKPEMRSTRVTNLCRATNNHLQLAFRTLVRDYDLQEQDPAEAVTVEDAQLEGVSEEQHVVTIVNGDPALTDDPEEEVAGDDTEDGSEGDVPEAEPRNLIEVLDLVGERKSPEEFLGAHLRGLCLEVFHTQFLPALAQSEKLAYSQQLSVEDLSDLAGLINLFLRRVDETVQGASREYQKHMTAAERKRDDDSENDQQDRVSAAHDEMFISFKRDLTGCIREFVRRVDQWSKRGSGKREEVAQLFQNVYLRTLEEYMELVDTPEDLVVELATNGTQEANPADAPLMDRRASGLSRAKWKRLQPWHVSFLQALIPEKCAMRDVPLSQAEHNFLCETLDGLDASGRLRSSLLKEWAGHLNAHYCGGLCLRNDRDLRNALPELRASLVQNLQQEFGLDVGVTLPSQITRSAQEEAEQEEVQTVEQPIQRDADRDKKMQLWSDLHRMYPLVTQLEFEILSRASGEGVPGVAQREARLAFCDRLAAQINEDLWGGQPDRDAQFVDLMLRAIRSNIIKVGDDQPVVVCAIPSEPIVSVPAVSEVAETTTETPIPIAVSVLPPDADPETAAVDEEAQEPVPQVVKFSSDQLIGIESLLATWRAQIVINAERRNPSVDEVNNLEQELHKLTQLANALLEEADNALEQLRGVLRYCSIIANVGKMRGAKPMVSSDAVRNAEQIIGKPLSEMQKPMLEVLAVLGPICKRYQNLMSQFNTISSRVQQIQREIETADSYFSRTLRIKTDQQSSEDSKQFLERLFGESLDDQFCADLSARSKFGKLLNDLDVFVHEEALGDLRSIFEPQNRKESPAGYMEDATQAIVIMPAIGRHSKTSSSARKPADSPGSATHSFATQQPPEHEVVTTMCVGQGDSKQEFGLTGLQVKLLQLLTSTPTNAGPMYIKKWWGRKCTHLQDLWIAAYGHDDDTPSTADIEEALIPLCTDVGKGRPNKNKRQGINTPLVLFRHERVRHKWFLPVDATLQWARTVAGEMQLQPEQLKRVVSVLNISLEESREKRRVRDEEFLRRKRGQSE
ncbi:hypothetical protein KKC44_05615 [Patescibacteria group bacterium]|nr:hypothetical protein [Patescibacteria group bacterium]MBU2260051.1 hypothetical protein [Patescibacteria group bacterium]